MSTIQDLQIRLANDRDLPSVNAVATDLSGDQGWFSAQGLKDIARDFTYQRCLVADRSGDLVGFLIFTCLDGQGWISWLGVRRNQHRAGAGRRLVEALAARMAADGITSLFVNTLGDSDDYEPYARTRAFYRALGFRSHRSVFQPANESCPEMLTMLRRLTPMADPASREAPPV